MPPKFQRAIQLTLTNCKITYAYLDDILVVTKGSTNVHRNTLRKFLQKLDEKNFATSIDKR